MEPTTQVAAVLQYGALGLLALMLGGVVWYVRETMKQQTAREEAACKERDRQLEAWMGLVKVLNRLNEKLDAHADETKQRHTTIDASLREIRDRLDRQ